MNTFAFVGNLDDHPTVSCVYHSEEAENQYLMNPRKLLDAQGGGGGGGAAGSSGGASAPTAAP